MSITVSKTVAAIIEEMGSAWDVKTHNGMITIHNGKSGNHVTFRILTVRKNKNGKITADLPEYMVGKRLVSKLVGPDRSLRSKDWFHFGYASEDNGVYVWKSVKNGDFGLAYQQVARMLNNLSKVRSTSFLTLLVEGTCRCCNRSLTNPNSIYTGIGPECAKKATQKVKIVMSHNADIATVPSNVTKVKPAVPTEKSVA